MVEVATRSIKGETIVSIKRKMKSFRNELALWNFESAVRIVSEFEDFPKNGYYLLKSLMENFGNCASCQTGSAYIGIPRQVDTIMGVISPWLELKEKGGIKPKAVAVK